MISRLVIVRHAKTQARAEGLDDMDRQLTSAGKCSIEVRYPMTLKLLGETSQEEVSLWSSPAVRALQTAEVIARLMELQEIEVKDSLYSDDVDQFVSELSKASGTVIAVGHNPFMEELYETLSESSQEFGTGAMASFSFQAPEEDESSASCSLEWFVQGPNVLLWKTVVEAEDVFAKAARRIQDKRAELLDDPDDPEALHQYRISIRIARSLLSFMLPYCKQKAAKKIMKDLKKLQDPTSRLRELDMLVKALDPLTSESILIRQACRREREVFIAELGWRSAQKVFDRAIEGLMNIPWSDEVKMNGLEENELVDRVAVMRDEYEEEMDALDYGDEEEVHDVRKDAKALRYVTREMAAFIPIEAASIGADAKAVQDRLGELCDHWNNAQLLVKICGPSAVGVASKFIVQADAVVEELKAERLARIQQEAGQFLRPQAVRTDEDGRSQMS